MYCMQYVAAACAGLAVASTSLHVLWPSAALPNILSGNSPIPQKLSEEEVSWIVMSLFLGTIPGAMISGWMLQKIGRKNSLVLLTAPLFLLWFPIAFTNSVLWLCIARVVAGFAISAIIIIVTLYNSEIADKRIRGRLGSFLNGFSLFGELLVACSGPFVSYRVLAFINCALPLAAAAVIYFIPESPYYFVQKGRKREAEIQVRRLMSCSDSEAYTNTAMNEIVNTVEAEEKNTSTMWGFLTEPLYRKSLIIIIGIKFIQQLSGSSAFGDFTNKAIEASQSSISQDVWEIILTAIPLMGVMLCGVFVDKIGRKPLLIISLLGSGVSLIAEGVCCMFIEHLNQDINHISWLSIGSLVMFSVMRPLGIGTLPYVLMGEMFATNIRHHAVTFCGTINAVTGFIMLKYFGQVSDVNALFVSFWVFAGICILAALFVYFAIPETRCKTFSEIQMDLKAVNGTLPPARPI